MANYINKNILCQAYIHVGIEDDFDVDRFKVQIGQFCQSRARFFFYEDIEVDVEIQEGSLKAKITVLGLVGGLLLNGVGKVMEGVANYPNFKEGVISITQDSKRLADYIGSESLFTTKTRPESAIRIEGRMGVIGSLRKILSQLEAIEKSNGRITEQDMSKRLSLVHKDIKKLLENIKGTDDEEFIMTELEKVVSFLPESPTPPPKHERDKVHLAFYRGELGLLRKRLVAKQKN